MIEDNRNTAGTIARPDLDRDELQRYSRHVMLPEVGVEGQKRLKQASVLLIGAGGLGSPAALYLAAAGVGRLGVIDPDTVDVSNLQRQVLFGSADAGRAKVEAGAERLKELNPFITIEQYAEYFSAANALEIASQYDIVVDGADNFSTRYLANDACALLGIPNAHGSIFRFEGQASVFWRGNGPCYRCIWPDPPPAGTVPSCGEIGVLGVLPGIIGVIQATEAVKLILGIGRPLLGRLLMYDALDMRFREMLVQPDPDCPICGENPTIRSLDDYDYDALAYCDSSSSRNSGSTATSHQHHPNASETMSIPTITVEEYAKMREENVPHTLIDVREEGEHAFCNIGGTLIPLGQIAQRVDEVPSEGDVIVYCRSGGRSGQAVAALLAAGRTNVKNMAGGILAWSDKIDPSIPKY